MDQPITPEQTVLARQLRVHEALRDIGRSQKWRALYEVLANLQHQATRELYEIPATDIATVARLQGECKAYDSILRQVSESEHRLAETRQKIDTQKRTNEVIEGLDREPPPGEDQ